MVLSCTTKEEDKRCVHSFCVAIFPFHNKNEKDLLYILGIKLFINSPFDIIIIRFPLIPFKLMLCDTSE